MGTDTQLMVTVGDRSATAEARRRAARIAGTLGFSEPASGALSLVVTEAATNVLKHAGRGQLMIRALQRGAATGIEVITLDAGPGIENITESMRDGHSTAGSPGTGLGAMSRNASEFDIYSVPGKGTAVRLVVWANGARPPSSDSLLVGAVCLPKPGEEAVGDAWTLLRSARGHALFVVDGLGHGADAAAAAHAAVAAASANADRSPAGLIDAVHQALRPTRGAAAAVALIEPAEARCTYCGIGNISACIVSDGSSRSLVSQAGILGHQARKVQEFFYPFPPGALLIAHSDGLATRWKLADYPGLERCHPALVAAVLFRDHSRGRDDATIVALRAAGERGA